MKRNAVLVMALLLVIAMAGTAMATNGMNMIGYNPRASGMGGADAAVDSDCSGTSCNPATIGRSRPRSAAIGLSLLMPQLSMSNQLNQGGVDGDDQIFPLPYLAYASKLGPESPMTLGFDLFAQGGMGVDFQGVNTPFGSSDEVTSEVAYMRGTLSGAYQATDSFSLGLGVMAGYATMKFSLFPNTYSPGADGTPGTLDDFGGMDVSGLTGIGVAGRIGAHYKVNDMISFGLLYTTPTALDMDGGDATLNFGAGANNPEYSAEMKDFTWPMEAEFGVALNVTPAFLIATDVKWINWSAAMDEVDLVVSDAPAGFSTTVFPDGQGGVSDTQTFNMNWDDQWVFAVGAEYQINAMNTVRVGYNYGKNPVPDTNLTPLFPAIVEHHVTVGYGLTLTKWAIDLAYEHAFENEQTGTATQGAEALFNGTTVSHSQNTVHMSLTYFY